MLRKTTALILLASTAQAGVVMDEVWYPDGVIRYWVGNAYSAAEESIVDNVLTLFDANTPLDVQPTTQATRNLKFGVAATTGCANVTYHYRVPTRPDSQKSIAMSLNGCLQPGDVVHEMGHALGFPHEFQRTDRDGHVNVISPLSLDPFNGYIAPDSRLTGPFDFNSMMGGHFGYSGAVALGGNEWDEQVFEDEAGSMRSLEVSAGDVNTIYRTYGQSLSGALDDARFGRAVAAGDFDADGVQDIAVATTLPDTRREIVLYVYKGALTDPTMPGTGTTYAPWFTYAVGETGAERQDVTLVTGDFDGDDIDELVIGNPSADEIIVLSINRRVVQFVGSAAVWGPFGRHDAIVENRIRAADVGLSATGGHRFGAALATGPLTARGEDDLIIGAPEALGVGPLGPFLPQSIGAIVHIPGTDVLASSPDHALRFNPDGAPGSEFGRSVSTVPRFHRVQVNGVLREYSAIVVGAPGHASDDGATYLLDPSVNAVGEPIVPDVFDRRLGTDAEKLGFEVRGFTTRESTSVARRYHVAVSAPEAHGSGRVDIDTYTRWGTRTTAASQTPSVVHGDDRYGTALAVYQEDLSHGDRHADEVFVAIRHPAGETNGQRTGVVELWRPFAGTRVHLRPADSTEGMRYGRSLATIRNGELGGGFLIGAPRAQVSILPPPLSFNVDAGRVTVRLNQGTTTSWSSHRIQLNQMTRGDRRPNN